MRTFYEYKAHVTDVYDGDTITVDVDLGFYTWIRDVKLRLYGINAPEVRGLSRSEGLASRDYLRGLLLDKDIIIETLKDRKGKYGRWLVKVWIEDEATGEINVNELLVQQGHAELHDYD